MSSATQTAALQSTLRTAAPSTRGGASSVRARGEIGEKRPVSSSRNGGETRDGHAVKSASIENITVATRNGAARKRHPVDAAQNASVKAADAALMKRIAAGDSTAAKEAINAHASRLHGLAFRMLSDATEAEDVAQEAMLRLWRVAPDWRAGEARISTWLHRVALNLCYDRLRKRRTTDLDEAPEQVDPTISVQAQLEARDDAAELRSALNKLPDRQRTAIVMRHFEEYSNPQIADALEISVEAVESLLARGRRALKAALGGVRK